MAEVQKQFSLFFSGTRLLVDGRIPDMSIFGFLFCCAAVFGPGSGADVRFSRFKKKVLRRLQQACFSSKDSGSCGRELQAQFRSTSGSATSFWVPSGRSNSFDAHFPHFYMFRLFRMSASSFWCSKDIYGGQSKSVLRRLQQVRVFVFSWNLQDSRLILYAL